jgi:hypothetical protein
MKLSIATYKSMNAICHLSAEEATLVFPDAMARAANDIPTYVLVGGTWTKGFEIVGVPGSEKRWPDNADTTAYRVYKVTLNANPRFQSFASFPLAPSFYKIPSNEDDRRYDVPLHPISPGHVICNKDEFSYDGPVHKSKARKPNTAQAQTLLARKTSTMDAERQALAGALSARSSFRLLVSGPFGENEIDSLIARLQFEKRILTNT